MWNFIHQFWLTWLMQGPQTVRLQGCRPPTSLRTCLFNNPILIWGWCLFGVFRQWRSEATLRRARGCCTLSWYPQLYERGQKISRPSLLFERQTRLPWWVQRSSAGLLWRQQKRTGRGEAIPDLSPSWLDRCLSPLSLQPQLNWSRRM